MSSEAEVDTKPELSIENDDVKCSHGATVGQLDSDQIFYLKTRGISTLDSQRILAKAFIDEVVYSVPNLLIREKITQTVGVYLYDRQ
jgi:Fe-S cluster assembly protein SufD